MQICRRMQGDKGKNPLGVAKERLEMLHPRSDVDDTTDPYLQGRRRGVSRSCRSRGGKRFRWRHNGRRPLRPRTLPASSSSTPSLCWRLCGPRDSEKTFKKLDMSSWMILNIHNLPIKILLTFQHLKKFLLQLGHLTGRRKTKHLPKLPIMADIGVWVPW